MACNRLQFRFKVVVFALVIQILSSEAYWTPPKEGTRRTWSQPSCSPRNGWKNCRRVGVNIPKPLVEHLTRPTADLTASLTHNATIQLKNGSLPAAAVSIDASRKVPASFGGVYPTTDALWTEVLGRQHAYQPSQALCAGRGLLISATNSVWAVYRQTDFALLRYDTLQSMFGTSNALTQPQCVFHYGTNAFYMAVSDRTAKNIKVAASTDGFSSWSYYTYSELNGNLNYADCKPSGCDPYRITMGFDRRNVWIGVTLWGGGPSRDWKHMNLGFNAAQAAAGQTLHAEYSSSILGTYVLCHPSRPARAADMGDTIYMVCCGGTGRQLAGFSWMGTADIGKGVVSKWGGQGVLTKELVAPPSVIVQDSNRVKVEVPEPYVIWPTQVSLFRGKLYTATQVSESGVASVRFYSFTIVGSTFFDQTKSSTSVLSNPSPAYSFWSPATVVTSDRRLVWITACHLPTLITSATMCWGAFPVTSIGTATRFTFYYQPGAVPSTGPGGSTSLGQLWGATTDESGLKAYVAGAYGRLSRQAGQYNWGTMVAGPITSTV